MINALDFPREPRLALWAEAAKFATDNDNLIVTTTKVHLVTFIQLVV